MKTLLATLLLATSTLTASEPFLEKLDLFTVGDHPNYNIYHIPGVVVTARGTVLVWCEARKRTAGVSDWDDIRILLRRSTDDGKSWSAPNSVVSVEGPKRKNPLALRMKNVDPNGTTYNNPVLIADKDGTVHMLFCLEYERAFYQRSEDDGISWSKPVEITSTFDAFKKHYDWKVLATGPNHSIQLKTGRLVVPVWLSTGEGGNAHRPSVTATIYSDDYGKTWKAGESVPDAQVEKEEMKFSYIDDDQYVFMNMDSFEEERISADFIGDKKNWIKEEMTFGVLKFKGKAIDVQIPGTMTLKVTEAEPGAKGNTAGGRVERPVKVETGAIVMVPMFVNEGDEIRIDTETGKYLGRAQE